MKVAKTVIEILLSSVIGIVVACVILLMSGGLAHLISSALFAIIVAFIVAILVYRFAQQTASYKLYSVFSGIVAFILWLLLCIKIDQSNISIFGGLFIISLPYIVTVYLLLVILPQINQD